MEKLSEKAQPLEACEKPTKTESFWSPQRGYSTILALLQNISVSLQPNFSKL